MIKDKLYYRLPESDNLAPCIEFLQWVLPIRAMNPSFTGISGECLSVYCQYLARLHNSVPAIRLNIRLFICYHDNSDLETSFLTCSLIDFNSLLSLEFSFETASHALLYFSTLNLKDTFSSLAFSYVAFSRVQNLPLESLTFLYVSGNKSFCCFMLLLN